jgi:predicted short-subunit dehydrogenase-like oxidoreductase (DUF2520 family)
MTQSPSSASPGCPIAVVGRGRLGGTLAAALSRAGYPVAGPLGRSYLAHDLAGAAVVLLCVPDRAITDAARWAARQLGVEHAGLDPPAPPSAALIGHSSGATSLQPLLEAARGRFDVFSLHPLMTLTGDDGANGLLSAPAAVSGSSPRARRAARELAHSVGLRPFDLEEGDRAVYHAAASVASNFLVTLEMAAERLASGAGLQRQQLVPLVRRTVDNWSALGAHALTGPIARGDEHTVARQRAAVDQHAPELLELFDALAAATRALAQAVPA